MSEMTERERLARSQKILNVAWIAGALGMASTLAGMGLGIPVPLIAPWLALCGFVAVTALVFSLIAYFSP